MILLVMCWKHTNGLPQMTPMLALTYIRSHLQLGSCSISFTVMFALFEALTIF